MHEQVIINDYLIEANQLQVSKITEEQERKKVSIDFQVTHDDYHAVTTLLYENDFIIAIPSKGLRIPAVIHSYSTSLDNLYNENTVGDFKLELVEKK